MRVKWMIGLVGVVAGPAAAHQQPAAQVEIRVERVAPGVAVLFGRGGNIGLSWGEDGNVLIDDQFAPLAPAILAAVRSVDPDPVRFVLNTHWHGDHTGGNEAMAREGAVIVAHDNVRRRLSMDQVVRGQAVPAAPSAARPVVTFASELSFHLNGDELRALHVPNAHTDGDTLIHWSRANVIHMGDTFFHGMLPFIDLDSGGSIDGLIGAADRALALADERTVIVPGHGPVARRADLAAYRTMLATIRGQVAQAMAAGRSLDEVKAMRLADAHGRAGDFIPPDAFVEAVWRSLERSRSAR